MRLGILGCGNMGSAIAKGILSKRIFPFNNIYVSDKDSQKTRELYRKFGIMVAASEEVVKKSNFIILAVKPQNSADLLSSIKDILDQNKHLISIMAGVKISRIESYIGKKIAITRAMPNMAAMVGKSITALSHNKLVKDKVMVHKVFSSIGELIELEEKYMDAVTAVSGSGPAYFFYLAECLGKAAEKLGIKKELALKLAISTLVGSGGLIEQLQTPPDLLRAQITSKKGTTEAALSVLKDKKLRSILEAAVKSAAQRSKELSK